MSAKQQTVPAGAAMLHHGGSSDEAWTLRGPGPGGAADRRPASGTADVFLHGAAGSWTTFLPLLARSLRIPSDDP